MNRSKRSMRLAGLMLACSTMFMGGCVNLGGFWRHFQIGFAEGVGAIPANFVGDLIFSNVFPTTPAN